MGRIRQQVFQARSGNVREAKAATEVPVDIWTQSRPIYFRKDERGGQFLVSGWSYPESNHTWSDGPQAVVEFPPPRDGSDVLFCFSLSPFCPPEANRQNVRIFSGRRLVGAWTIDRTCDHALLVPRWRGRQEPIRLTWEFPDAFSPREIGLSADPRRLAVALISMTAAAL